MKACFGGYRTGLAVFGAIWFGSLAAQTPADMFKPSKKDQVTLGLRVAKDIRQHEKVLPESDIRVKTLRRIADRILAQIPDDEKKTWQFSFDVVDSKEINAFALPGGPVFFYTGLLNKIDTEDQIAAVLGHELTHVRKEHWARSYADQQKRALGLNLLLIFAHANTTTANIASIANDVAMTLPMSRRYEMEADDVGFDVMIKAGYNPQGMIDVFQMLSKVGGGKGPEWLNTHPDDKKRIKARQDKLATLHQQFPPQIPVPYERTKEPEKTDKKKPPPVQ